MAYRRNLLSVLECNIDDMNPEVFPWVSEKLFTAGARDVWLTPIIMKLGRPASCLSVLCDKEKIDSLLSIVFSETTTIGVRLSAVERIELDREKVAVQTPYGAVELKLAKDEQGNVLNVAPEYSSARKCACESGAALKEVYESAHHAFRTQSINLKKYQ